MSVVRWGYIYYPCHCFPQEIHWVIQRLSNLFSKKGGERAVYTYRALLSSPTCYFQTKQGNLFRKNLFRERICQEIFKKKELLAGPLEISSPRNLRQKRTRSPNPLSLAISFISSSQKGTCNEGLYLKRKSCHRTVARQAGCIVKEFHSAWSSC